MDSAFANMPQPHGALFSDVPNHIDGDDYTWTEEAAPAGVYIVPADDGARAPFVTRDDLNEMRLTELNAGLRELQADVRHLQTIVHRLLNRGCED